MANDFKEETLAAVLWLRDSNVDITCIKLEAYQVGDEIIITPDIIIPLPEAKNFMFHREQKSKITSQKRPNKNYEFWSKILTEIKELKPELPDISPNKYIWLPIPTEYDKIHFEFIIRKRPKERFIIAIHFEKPDKNENLELLNYCRSRIVEIEEKLPEETIIFDENFVINGCKFT